LVPYQGPPERFAPEAPEGTRAVTVDSSETRTARKEPVAWFDDTELVALRIGEREMGFVLALTDVNVSRSDRQELSDCVGLVRCRGAREIEVNSILTDLVFCAGSDIDPEARGVGRHELDAKSIAVAEVPVERALPELSQSPGSTASTRRATSRATMSKPVRASPQHSALASRPQRVVSVSCSVTRHRPDASRCLSRSARPSGSTGLDRYGFGVVG
jgi:hypothetical protein